MVLLFSSQKLEANQGDRINMGLHFGNLWKYYGRVTYRLSPYEMNPLKGILNPGFTNTCRRFGENIPTVAPRKSTQILIILSLSLCINLQVVTFFKNRFSSSSSLLVYCHSFPVVVFDLPMG